MAKKINNWVFLATPEFWKSFKRLPLDQQTRAKAVFTRFKEDPFDPGLRPHKINRLSAIYRRTIHSVTIESDLRAVFYVEDNMIVSVDIGTHAIYK